MAKTQNRLFDESSLIHKRGGGGGGGVVVRGKSDQLSRLFT